MSIGQQFRVSYHITDPVLGWDLDLPAYTCAHCNRCIAPGLGRLIGERASRAEADRAIAGWRAKVGVCRKCDANVCAFCVKVDGECTSFAAEQEKAGLDLWKQPWFLRSRGEPVRRILDQWGNPILVMARDVGYTDREMERIAGELNFDGSAKRIAGEQVLV